jgi:hypothetical protein
VTFGQVGIEAQRTVYGCFHQREPLRCAIRMVQKVILRERVESIEAIV